MKICKFDGCENRHKAFGLCEGHYMQQRQDRPITTLSVRAKKGEIIEWISRQIGTEQIECIEWPFGLTRGRPGTVQVDGKEDKATTWLLEMSGFARPSSKHLACHSCDNILCMNPNHLRWGTHKDNADDMIERGRHAWQRHEKLVAWLDENGIEFPEEMR